MLEPLQGLPLVPRAFFHQPPSFLGRGFGNGGTGNPQRLLHSLASVEEKASRFGAAIPLDVASLFVELVGPPRELRPQLIQPVALGLDERARVGDLSRLCGQLLVAFFDVREQRFQRALGIGLQRFRQRQDLGRKTESLRNREPVGPSGDALHHPVRRL